MGKRMKSKAAVEQAEEPEEREGVEQAVSEDRSTWPVEAVLYVRHLPISLEEHQLHEYFSQYGEVVEVKLHRSKHTHISKGEAFLQFRSPSLASQAADFLNGYLLDGHILLSYVLTPQLANPFTYPQKPHKFKSWKRLHLQQKHRPTAEEQTSHLIHSLLRNEEKKRSKLAGLSLNYDYKGFSSFLGVAAE